MTLLRDAGQVSGCWRDQVLDPFSRTACLMSLIHPSDATALQNLSAFSCNFSLSSTNQRFPTHTKAHTSRQRSNLTWTGRKRSPGSEAIYDEGLVLFSGLSPLQPEVFVATSMLMLQPFPRSTSSLGASWAFCADTVKLPASSRIRMCYGVYHRI
ncbi:hypothetical protein LZ30DRAFT_808372 [Colletotrichum cereale]|nr:hypothetical protein LZ30DRAFT_808372 [Colletotrichum cereale]